MLYKEYQSQKSLLDYILQVMPELQVIEFRRVGPNINNSAAKKLFSLWKDERNKEANFTLKRPTTVSSEDVEMMAREGLVKHEGDRLKVTTKGAEIIRTMILGDDKSAFDDNGEILDYQVAYANTKPRRKVKTGSVRRLASKQEEISGGNWYHRNVAEGE